MSDLPTILPHNAQAIEFDLEQLSARQRGFGAPIRALWSVEDIQADLLGYLAWALSVDSWDPAWPDERMREAIRQSIAVHRRKGTVGSIRRALTAYGYPNAIIMEGIPLTPYDGAIDYSGDYDHGGPNDWSIEVRHDGSILYNGYHYGPEVHWADYSVRLEGPITIRQAADLRKILGEVAPARCRLRRLYFIEAGNIHNGAIQFDGAYSYGVA